MTCLSFCFAVNVSFNRKCEIRTESCKEIRNNTVSVGKNRVAVSGNKKVNNNDSECVFAGFYIGFNLLKGQTARNILSIKSNSFWVFLYIKEIPQYNKWGSH